MRIITLLFIASLAWAECQSHVELPFGGKDGVNRVFELQREPAADAPYFKVTINNKEVPTDHYERDGKKITFKEGKQPKAEDMFLVYYRSGDNCR